MPGKQLSLFATQGDLLAVLQEASSVNPLDFAVMGLFDEAEPILLDDPGALKPLTAYLAFGRGLSVAVRPVPQRRGGMKYAVDPMENPWAVVLRCGGRVDTERLVSGDVSTATRDEQAEALYQLFSKAIRSRFEKIKSYYVGPEAAELLDSGVRLTSGANSPATYDLVR